MNSTDHRDEAAKTANGQQGFQSDVTDLELNDAELNDAELERALGHFKASIDAWSEAAYSRPRQVAHTVRQRTWRLAAGWALGCVLVAGGVGGGLVERHQRIDAERQAAAQSARDRAQAQQRQVEAQQAQAKPPDAKAADAKGSTAKDSDEVLLAGVDTDVSRQVPDAMEPLAQLMQDDDKQ